MLTSGSKQDLKKKKRIYDCFIFYNELDLLELRLQENFDKVDIFVICEAPLTFKGSSKPLFFRDSRQRFGPYIDKIRYITADDMPRQASAWEREFFQRNAIKRGILDANASDIVIVSDCDEVPSPAALDYLREHDGYFSLDMPMYQFYLNMMAVEAGWNKVFAYSYSLSDAIPDYSRIRQIPDKVFEQFSGTNHKINAAGWHFTFLGGVERIRQKIQAYSHAEKWQQSMLKAGNADRQMRLLKDVGGGKFLRYCAIDQSFPKTVVANYEYFVQLGLIKEAGTRLVELQQLVVEFEREQRESDAERRYLLAEADRLRSGKLDVNIALGKPATQSSLSKWSRRDVIEKDAAGGNNGRIYCSYGFHTEHEVNPWWQVDLQQVYCIREIVVYNRPDAAYRLRKFSILGSRDGKRWDVFHQKADDVVFGDGKMEPYSVHLEGCRARFVKIRLDGTDFLHFDECLIFGDEFVEVDAVLDGSKTKALQNELH